jgi:hypothetical protein
MDGLNTLARAEFIAEDLLEGVGPQPRPTRV